eukprot:gene7935-10768_t
MEEEARQLNLSADYSNFKSKSWIDRDGVHHKAPELTNTSLKIVSYNILGPLHGEGSKHEYAPVSVTKWTRRRDVLIQELIGLNADIFCLQEVSFKSLRETFIPGMKRIGLECCGYAPTKTSHESKGKFGHKNIGSAMFYNPQKLNIVTSKKFHLKDFALLNHCRSHEFVVDVHSKMNTMLIVQFNVTATNENIIIGNTHLFWDPAREDIKTIQALAVTQCIQSFCNNCKFEKNNLPPLIICGDFNAMPNVLHDDFGDYKSALFEIFSNGYLNINHPQHPDNWFNTKVNANSPNPRLGQLNSNLILHNIYEMNEFIDSKPLFTTKTDEFQGWIDHIWTNNKIDVDMVLSPPIRSGDLEANIKGRRFAPIPNKNFPSDHLPIGLIARIRS